MWEKPTSPAAGRGSIKKIYVVYEALFRQGMYYGMKHPSGNDICGCDICWKARYDGTPGGAGVVQTGKIWRMLVGKLIRQVEYGICYKYVKYGG